MAKKQVSSTITSQQDLENVMGEYASAYIERERLRVAMEEDLATVRRRYEDALAAASGTLDGLFEDIQSWAILNQREFATRKSIELVHGTIGFRTNPPAVKQISGVKAEHTVDLLRRNDQLCYLRVKSELDKEAILLDHASGKLGVQELAEIGLKIVQAETFFADVRKDPE